MKKTSIISSVLICVLLGLSVFFYYNRTAGSRISLEQIEAVYDKSLHELDFSKKGLTSVPDICTIIAGTQYEEDVYSINLSSNNITTIGDGFHCLKNLNEISLAFNKISKIENLDKFVVLRKLDLGNNQITNISGLERMPYLQDLHLGYNQLSTTEGLGFLVGLSSLQLQSNKLTDIKEIEAMKNLETLKLEFNQLDDADVQFLDQLTKLKHISIGENKINSEIVEKWNSYTLSKRS